jgi:hypothetical protein
MNKIMGPTLIFDKSVLHSLSENEIFILNKYFSINLVPVLIREILGDLVKPKEKISVSKNPVIILANKIVPLNSSVNMSFISLIKGELLGNKFPIDVYRCIVDSSPPKVDKEGKKIVMVNESLEECQIEKWRTGDFSPDDYIISKIMRSIIKDLDLENFKNQMKKTKIVQSFKSLELIVKYIDDITKKKYLQENILNTIFSEFLIEDDIVSKARYFWVNLRKPYLSNIFPYSLFCFKSSINIYFSTC